MGTTIDNLHRCAFYFQQEIHRSVRHVPAGIVSANVLIGFDLTNAAFALRMFRRLRDDVIVVVRANWQEYPRHTEDLVARCEISQCVDDHTIDRCEMLMRSRYNAFVHGTIRVLNECGYGMRILETKDAKSV